MASLAKGEVTQVKSTLGTMLNFSLSFYIKQIDILLCNLQYCRPFLHSCKQNTNLRFRVKYKNTDEFLQKTSFFIYDTHDALDIADPSGTQDAYHT